MSESEKNLSTRSSDAISWASTLVLEPVFVFALSMIGGCAVEWFAGNLIVDVMAVFLGAVEFPEHFVAVSCGILGLISHYFRHT